MVDQKVSDVLSYTEDMMGAAIEDRWDELIEMQAKQDQMIKDIFYPVGRLFLDKEKKELLEVERLNQEILSAAELHKTEIANKLRTMRKGKVKASVYQAL